MQNMSTYVEVTQQMYYFKWGSKNLQQIRIVHSCGFQIRCPFFFSTIWQNLPFAEMLQIKRCRKSAAFPSKVDILLGFTQLKFHLCSDIYCTLEYVFNEYTLHSSHCELGCVCLPAPSRYPSVYRRVPYFAVSRWIPCNGRQNTV